MLKNYFITAIRNLFRNKLFSLINILGLSIGIACCMLIILYSKDEVSFDHFHSKKENIYRLTADMISPEGAIDKIGNTGMMPGPSLEKSIPEISEFVRIQPLYFTLRSKGNVFDEEVLATDDNLFSVFSFPLLHGDPKTALKNLHSIVVSETIAEKYFGSTDVVGKTMELKVKDTFEPFEVSAVMKNAPQNSSLRPQLLLPMKFQQTLENDHTWMNFFLNTFVVVKPNTNIQALEAKCNQVIRSESATEAKQMADQFGFKSKVKYHLQPLLAMHLSTEFPVNNGLVNASNPLYSYILIGIAFFVLVIACINFINLTVARSLKRAKEIGVRKVIGSGRNQLIFQFLGESFVLSFFAFITAAILTYVSLPFFNSLSNKALAFSYLFDTKLIAGYIGLFLLTGLLAGFYPAIVLSGFKPVETLYGKLRFSSRNYLSKGLVVFQFALATFLIISTLTIYSQFNYLLTFDLGYNDKNIVTFNTGTLNDEQLLVLKNELYKSPSVLKVSADQGGSRTTVANINGNQEFEFNYAHIDPEFLPLFKIGVAAGRNFSEKLSSDSVSSVIVNETFVKKAGWKKPLGEVVDFFYNKKKFHVIGVIKDYHFESLTQNIRPQLFTYNSRERFRRVYVKLAVHNKADALQHIESTFKQLYPVQPYSYTFDEENNAANYESEAKWKQIVAFSALLTILISCVGLFGLAVLAAEKRAKEIGIRRVLGAPVLSIVKKLSSDFVKPVAIAVCLALPAAWWSMNTWLENYPYRVQLNAVMFGSAIGLVLLVALLTVGFQALKAALVNPTKSLRSE